MSERSDEPRQVVGGILPDQDDAGGNFSQTDSSGGPGDRPVIRAAGHDPGDAGDAPDADKLVGPDQPADLDAIPPDVAGE